MPQLCTNGCKLNMSLEEMNSTFKYGLKVTFTHKWGETSVKGGASDFLKSLKVEVRRCSFCGWVADCRSVCFYFFLQRLSEQISHASRIFVCSCFFFLYRLQNSRNPNQQLSSAAFFFFKNIYIQVKRNDQVSLFLPRLHSLVLFWFVRSVTGSEIHQLHLS